MTLAELFIGAGLVGSRNEARRLATQGGLSLNEQRVDNVDVPFAAPGEVVLLRVGKKRYRYARLTGP
jgi:tyrosyl-tRNA synthetase